MGTKQLQADKRVEEITLNEAGKAATLTLKPGWTFEGQRGPFTLKNVEHGHQIVRGAQADGSVAKAPRAPRKAPSGPAEPPGDTPGAHDRKPLPKFDAPVAPRGHVIIAYRMQLMPKDDDREMTAQGKEVCGWLQVTRELPKKELEERTWSMLGHHIPGVSRETHEARSFRWTNKMQKAARAAGEMGSPWHGENHGD